MSQNLPTRRSGPTLRHARTESRRRSTDRALKEPEPSPELNRSDRGWKLTSGRTACPPYLSSGVRETTHRINMLTATLFPVKSPIGNSLNRPCGPDWFWRRVPFLCSLPIRIFYGFRNL